MHMELRGHDPSHSMGQVESLGPWSPNKVTLWGLGKILDF